MENVKIYISNKEFDVLKGTTLAEISKDFSSDFKYDIILAKVNGIYNELSYVVKGNEKIEFVDLLDSFGNRAYLNGLIFILSYVVKNKYNSDVKINHSLDKGLYITTDIKLNDEVLTNISNEMLNIVSKDIVFHKSIVKRSDAINYYSSINDSVKIDNLRYNTNSYVTLYKLENVYEYFYSLMPISTGILKYFKFILIDENSFVMTFPTIYMEEDIKQYEHRKNMLDLFNESREWASRIGLRYVCDLNRAVSNSDINSIIRIDEIEKNSKLLSVAKSISMNPDARIILIAGPSSSGKTTTTNKLTLCFRSVGKKPKMISMDDFFHERENTPIGEDGNPDFECLEAIDLDLFDKTLKSLLDGKETVLPKYNFLTGKKEYKDKMILGDDEVLLIEGIHAINPEILTSIDNSKKVKIYLSALTELNIDGHTRISTTDNRLLRRIVRDNRTRGYNIEKTLENWAKVREGEEKYIFPYQDMADYTINTAMIYEIGVLKVYVEPLLYSVNKDSLYYNDAKRLINFLKLFLPIPADEIPCDSIIREFVGGGCFKI